MALVLGLGSSGSFTFYIKYISWGIQIIVVWNSQCLDKKNLKKIYKLRYSNHIKNMYAAKHPSSIAANSPRSLPITIEPENGTWSFFFYQCLFSQKLVKFRKENILLVRFFFLIFMYYFLMVLRMTKLKDNNIHTKYLYSGTIYREITRD